MQPGEGRAIHKGGSATGPNPTDRGKPGTKRHLVVDANGTPLGLTLTGAGPGAYRLFLRGIADSVFNGFSQSTVSVQLDDARITYDAAEPGLRSNTVSPMVCAGKNTHE